MKLMQRGSKFYVVKRVPARFRAVEQRQQVWISLDTDSRREAANRAVDAVRDLENFWIAKASPQASGLYAI